MFDDVGEFLAREFQPREMMFAPWLPTQGIAMIHAERGIGKIVKQSGGNVKIYSESGQGTTVKMYFPRRGEQSEDDNDDVMPLADAASETILVVEDDEDVRLYLIEALRELNYRAIGAPDPVAALGVLENSRIRIDLMLTDVVMPGMNGRELSGVPGSCVPG
jgi:PleD family two-component response regulator